MLCVFFSNRRPPGISPAQKNLTLCSPTDTTPDESSRKNDGTKTPFGEVLVIMYLVY